MRSYQQGFDWEDAWVDGWMGLIVAGAAMLITIILVLAKEVARIYLAHAFTASRTARVLWAALAGLVLIWCIAALLVAGGEQAFTGLLLASYGFLAFVVAIEGCDLIAAHQAREDAAALGELDSYLEPFAAAAPAPNGHTQMPFGALS